MRLVSLALVVVGLLGLGSLALGDYPKLPLVTVSGILDEGVNSNGDAVEGITITEQFNGVPPAWTIIDISTTVTVTCVPGLGNNFPVFGPGTYTMSGNPGNFFVQANGCGAFGVGWFGDSDIESGTYMINVTFTITYNAWDGKGQQQYSGSTWSMVTVP